MELYHVFCCFFFHFCRVAFFVMKIDRITSGLLSLVIYLFYEEP